jgi:regulator of cell morphogenesis and NO signaling
MTHTSARSAAAPSSTPLLQRPVGEIVAEDYGRAAVLRRFGIDFCCGGGRPLGEACAARHADPEEVTAALAAHDARSTRAGDAAPADPADLVDHIERVHHAWVRENLPALLHFTSRVAKVHGDGWPELRTIAERTHELAVEMEDHMVDEEENLFPLIRSAHRDGGRGTDTAAALSAAALSAAALSAAALPASAFVELEAEHEHAGALMRELRELTSGFTPPASACATWKAAYAKLEEFEADLHRHVHLENNVLFPAVRGS